MDAVRLWYDLFDRQKLTPPAFNVIKPMEHLSESRRPLKPPEHKAVGQHLRLEHRIGHFREEHAPAADRVGLSGDLLPERKMFCVRLRERINTESVVRKSTDASGNGSGGKLTL